MNSFAQRVDEKSAINPSGFTGVIVQNSNAVIDKTFIEKGTSFVNAYENSNVVLKDCGTPNPTFSENTTIAKRLKSNLKVEIERAKLPPWVYYKLGRTNNFNVEPKNFDSSRSKTFELELINSYDTDKLQDMWTKISEYRSSIIGSSFRKSKDDSKFYNYESLSIENQILTSGDFSTKDVDFTVSGMYWLEGVESAIKVVWPLDKKHQTSIDNPRLNLRYKERILFPLRDLNSNEFIYMNNTYKEDELGNYILSDEQTNDFSPKTHKRIVKSSLNRLEEDADAKWQRLENEKLILNELSGVFYFNGPYYSKNEIAYYVNDKYNGKQLKNDENVTDFYFNLDGNTYGLFDVVNKTDKVPSTVITLLNNEYLFNSRFDDLNRFKVDILTMADEWDSRHLGTQTNVVGLVNVNSANNTSLPLATMNGQIATDVTKYILASSDFDLTDLRAYPFYKTSLTDSKIYMNEDFQNGFFFTSNAHLSSIFTLSNDKISLTLDRDDSESKVMAPQKKIAANSFTVCADFEFSSFDDCSHEGDDHTDACSSNFFTQTNGESDWVFGFNDLINQSIQFSNIKLSSITLACSNTAHELNVFNNTGGEKLSLPISNVVPIISKSTLSTVTSSVDHLQNYENFNINAANLPADHAALTYVFNIDTEGNITTKEDKDQTHVRTAILPIFKNYPELVGLSSDTLYNPAFNEVYAGVSSNFLKIISDNNKVSFIIYEQSATETNVFYILSSDFCNNNNWYQTSTHQCISVTSTDAQRIKSKQFSACTQGSTAGSPKLSAWLFDVARKKAEFTTKVNDGWLGIWYDSDNNPVESSDERTINAFKTIILNELDEIGYIDLSKLERYESLANDDTTYENIISTLNDINKLPSYILFKVNADGDNDQYYVYRITIGSYINFFEEDKPYPLTGGVQEYTYTKFDVAEMTTSNIPSGIINAVDGYQEFKSKSADEVKQATQRISGNLNIDNLTNALTEALKNQEYLVSANGTIECELNNIDPSYLEGRTYKTSGELADAIKVAFKNMNNANPYDASSIVSGFGVISAMAIATPEKKIVGKLSATLLNDLPTNIITDDAEITFDFKENNGWYTQKSVSSYYIFKSDVNLAKKSIASDAYNTNAVIKFYKLNVDEDTLSAMSNVYDITENNDKAMFRVYAENEAEAIEQFNSALPYAFEEITINEKQQPSSITESNGLLYNVTSDDGRSFNVKGALHVNRDGVVYLTSYPSQSSLYYYGIPLDKNFTNLTDVDVKLNVNSIGTYYDVVIDQMKDKQGRGNICLYFDKNCKIPVEVSGLPDTENYIFYDHDSNGYKKMNDGAFVYLPEYKYQIVSAYISDTFSDWFNANTYINYAKINDEQQNYSITFNNISNERLSSRFTDDYFVVTNGNVQSDDYTSITLNTSGDINADNKFNTLFMTNDEKRQQLKMLSFNFYIPKSGWYEFDERMYAKNPNYTRSIKDDATPTIPSVDAISAAQLMSVCEFDGVFYAKYKLYTSDIRDDQNNLSNVDDRISAAYVENTHVYKTYFQAKVRHNKSNTNTIRLDVFSENSTLSFSTDLEKQGSTDIFATIYELKGLILTFKDNNNSAHHIQFPHIKVYCAYDNANHKLLMTFKTSDVNFDNITASLIAVPTEASSYYINYDLMKKGTPRAKMLAGSNGLSYADAKTLNNWLDTLSATYCPTEEGAAKKQISASDLKTWQNKFAKYGVSLSAISNKLSGAAPTDSISLNEAKNKLKEKIGNIEINEFKLDLPDGFTCKAAVTAKSEEQWGPDFPTASDSELKPNAYVRILLKDIAAAKGGSKSYMHNVTTRVIKYNERGERGTYQVEIRDRNTGKIILSDTEYNNYGGNTPTGCSGIISSIIDFFGENGKAINGKTYKVVRIYERHHCSNITLQHDAFLVMLHADSISYYSTFKTSPSSIVGQDKFELANILPQIEIDKTTEYFKNYMTINDLAFMAREVENDESFLESSNWSAWEAFTPQSNAQSSFIGAVNDNLSSITVLDLEPFVKPFDMSTNLLYYKGSDPSDSSSGLIKSTDEVLIINAKKMYNSVDDTDERPKDGALSLQLKNLFDKEITLTGKIVLNDDPFEEIYPYVNDDYKYSFSTEIADDDLINGGYRRVKYTDYRAKAPIWRLHKLKPNMLTLTTIDGFKAKFSPIAPSNDNIKTLEQNDIELPCKLSLKFDDLIFKQKTRSGSRFDDVVDISYKNRIFRNDFLTTLPGALSEDLQTRWHAQPFESGSIEFEFPHDPSTPGDNQIVSPTSFFKINLEEVIDKNPDTKIGGSAYFNDVAKMNTVANSVNKWETVYSRDKYANLEVFSDYCPGDHCIGTPYVNMATKVGVYEEYENGNIGGGAGLISGAASVGEVMQIATDRADVNNIKTLETVEALPDYTTNSDAARIECTVVSAGIIDNGLLMLSATIEGSVLDTSLIGKKAVPINFKNAEDVTNIISINENEHNSIYIYFDGLYFDKDVYLKDTDVVIETVDKARYTIADIQTSNVYLDKDGQLSGVIMFQASLADDVLGSTLEVHNVKPLSPTITELKVSFTDDEAASVDKNGFIDVDDNIWQKKVKFNDKGFIKYDGEEQPIFTLESEPIKSWVKEVYDDDNKLTELIVTVKIGGIKKFEQPKYNTYYYFDNPTLVTLSSKELVDDYNEFDTMTRGNDANIDDAAEYFQEVFPEFVPSAQLGQTVASGILRWKTNDVKTSPFSGVIEDAGIYAFDYNPIGRDEFQIEILSKLKGESLFNKEVYYTNLKTDRWYNLSLFNLLKKRNSDVANAESVRGLYITDVTGQRLEDITTKQTDIIRCFVSNDKIIEGNQIYSDIQDADTLKDVISSNYLHNYKSVYNISFDACNRTPYNLYYSDDAEQLQYNDVEITDIEYEKPYRNKKDLWKFGDSLDNLGLFTNEDATIKLFANKELNEALNDTSENAVKLIDFTDTSIEYSEINNCPVASINVFEGESENNSKEMHKMLNRYIPRRVYLGSDVNDYILREKDMTYHIAPVNGMKAKSIMFINTPNLYNSDADKSYYDTSVGALSAIQESFEYFSNPQHKLPCVNYTQKILDSDYATLVYNSCQTFEAAKSATSLNYNDSTIIYNYDKNPKIIAYVWDNAKVSRNETYDKNGNAKSQKLCWVKSAYNEYIAEVGSIYNYQDSQDYVNIVKIETGAITERQVVMQPVLSTPLTFEKKSAETGIVKVNDKIIATAALGYNNVGYPINSVMLFNPENALNNDISIDTTQTTYLYVAQNDQSSECIVGSTQEKPVYVDMISQNVASNNERFNFLPNPYNTGLEPEDLDPTYNLLYQGTASYTGVTQNDKMVFKLGYADSLSELSSSYIELSSLGLTTTELQNLIESENIEKNVTPIGNHTYYDYKQNLIIRNTGVDKIITYYNNALAANSIGTSENSLNRLDLKNVLNVFSDETQTNILAASGINTSWETMNCFSFDGKLIGSDAGSAERPIRYTNMVDNKSEDLANNFEYIFSNGLKDVTDIEPTIAAVWLTDAAKQINYSDYLENISKNINNERSVVFDQYYSANITSVKFTINSENIKNAPIYIKISFLKAEKDSNNRMKFVWKHNDIYDVDLRDTYKDEFDLVGSKKEIIKDFILQPNGDDIIKHVFGIKFTIKQIMPQNDEYNKAIIDNIAIYASNVLNKYGQSLSVEDVYVRKADANCRNHYKMDVAEYVWRLPKRASEWKTLFELLSGDYETDNVYINQDEYTAVSSTLSSLANSDINATINDILNGNNVGEGKQFSFLNSYFITSNTGEDHIKEVLSDSYLVESNMKITWKYVDYVYIYYSCYSPNARQLIERKFGDKIYNAVKAKLTANINNMNANSAFKDKFEFKGGIAVSKSEILDENQHTDVFTWNQTRQLKTGYTNVYTTTQKWGTETQDAIYEVTTYRDKYATRKRKSTYLDTTVTGVSTVKQTTSKDWHTTETTMSERIDSEEDHYGTTIENGKYMSVDNWTNSFAPIMIKYQID